MKPNGLDYSFNRPKDDDNINFKSYQKLDALFFEFTYIMKTIRELSDKEFKTFNDRLMGKE